MVFPVPCGSLRRQFPISAPLRRLPGRGSTTRDIFLKEQSLSYFRYSSPGMYATPGPAYRLGRERKHSLEATREWSSPSTGHKPESLSGENTIRPAFPPGFRSIFVPGPVLFITILIAPPVQFCCCPGWKKHDNLLTCRHPIEIFRKLKGGIRGINGSVDFAPSSWRHSHLYHWSEPHRQDRQRILFRYC